MPLDLAPKRSHRPEDKAVWDDHILPLEELLQQAINAANRPDLGDACKELTQIIDDRRLSKPTARAPQAVLYVLRSEVQAYRGQRDASLSDLCRCKDLLDAADEHQLFVWSEAVAFARLQHERIADAHNEQKHVQAYVAQLQQEPVATAADQVDALAKRLSGSSLGSESGNRGRTSAKSSSTPSSSGAPVVPTIQEVVEPPTRAEPSGSGDKSMSRTASLPSLSKKGSEKPNKFTKFVQSTLSQVGVVQNRGRKKLGPETFLPTPPAPAQLGAAGPSSSRPTRRSSAAFSSAGSRTGVPVSKKAKQDATEMGHR